MYGRRYGYLSCRSIVLLVLLVGMTVFKRMLRLRHFKLDPDEICRIVLKVKVHRLADEFLI